MSSTVYFFNQEQLGNLVAGSRVLKIYITSYCRFDLRHNVHPLKLNTPHDDFHQLFIQMIYLLAGGKSHASILDPDQFFPFFRFVDYLEAYTLLPRNILMYSKSSADLAYFYYVARIVLGNEQQLVNDYQKQITDYCGLDPKHLDQPYVFTNLSRRMRNAFRTMNWLERCRQTDAPQCVVCDQYLIPHPTSEKYTYDNCYLMPCCASPLHKRCSDKLSRYLFCPRCSAFILRNGSYDATIASASDQTRIAAIRAKYGIPLNARLPNLPRVNRPYYRFTNETLRETIFDQLDVTHEEQPLWASQ